MREARIRIHRMVTQDGSPRRWKISTVMIHCTISNFSNIILRYLFALCLAIYLRTKINLNIIKLKHFDFVSATFLFFLSRPTSSRFCKILNRVWSKTAGWIFFSLFFSLFFVSHGWMLQRFLLQLASHLVDIRSQMIQMNVKSRNREQQVNFNVSLWHAVN